MYNPQTTRLGEEKSAIRDLFDYGNKRKREIGEENVFDFSLGNPSVPAPSCVCEEIERLIATVPAENLHGYTTAAGSAETREAVAAYISRTFGIPMPRNLVYITCGASASLTVTLHALLCGGEEVVVIAPYFPEYRVFIEGAGGKTVVCPTDETFHLDIAALDRAIGARTKAVILNSPNNPSGAVYGEEELIALSRLLRRKSEERGEPVFLLSDEPYRELSYGAEVPYAMNYYENTAVLYSFSKSLSLAGERIGYIAVSPRCADAQRFYASICGAGRRLGFVCAPSLFQRVIAKCVGQSTDVGEYRKNRDLLYGALKEMGYECAKPEGAFYLFVKAPEADAKAFCERAKRHELLLVPSDSFGIEGYVRISYCVSRSVIERSLPAFRALIEEYRK